MFAALALAVLCAPGTWLRTEVPRTLPTGIEFNRIAGASPTDLLQWNVAGVWHYTSDPSRFFGGFSAMLPLRDGHLRAFSDRGSRFTFTEPDLPDPAMRAPSVVLQLVAPRHSNVLWDIESVTRDPVSRDYWLGYEGAHAIHRFSVASEIEEVRFLDGEVDWYVNSGAEAMLRLSDGRFVIIPEGRGEALIYAGDPVEGGTPVTIDFTVPVEDFVVTAAAQMPDGRVLLLMRDVVWGVPPFAGLLAIADTPPTSSDTEWSADVLIHFDGVIPPENYEGLAVRGQDDGTVAVWVISDDNFSIQQRTLLVKLVFDPAADRATDLSADLSN
ncbi:esterase-like activity of phytase family protein [uncultured Erythrobacter sp.]|uniref:esterase-like activity of phytase family protein n=1 Tax=uncultured Erythrobacter sp. TaxID=263913 RepID=UPI00261B2CC9|nr:esterase-like activity of phytase family protein [uncultured Erythrobacter sp.]